MESRGHKAMTHSLHVSTGIDVPEDTYWVLRESVDFHNVAFIDSLCAMKQKQKQKNMLSKRMAQTELRQLCTVESEYQAAHYAGNDLQWRGSFLINFARAHICGMQLGMLPSEVSGAPCGASHWPPSGCTSHSMPMLDQVTAASTSSPSVDCAVVVARVHVD